MNLNIFKVIKIHMIPNQINLIPKTDNTMSSNSEPRILSATSNSASSSSSSSKKYTVVPQATFDAILGLNEDLLRGIYSYGFTTPSKPQTLGIKPMIDGEDLILQSQSGTGKTPAFVIGGLNHLDEETPHPQVLVISHTRELTNQTATVAKGLGQYLGKTGVKVMTATGGTPVSEDLKALRNGAQFIVGTPGRIYDLIKRGMNLKHLKYLILDEADKLLEKDDDGSPGFGDQICEILATGAFPETTHLAMFSATMPAAVLTIADRFLKDAVHILIPTEEVKLEGIKQFYIDCEKSEWKKDVLADLYTHMSVSQGIIFANKKTTVEILANSMTKDGFTLEYIHGDMETAERKKRMDDFRTGKVRILVSTDVLARGIDVQSVDIVINYEMPMDREDYFHRIGRCGRFGKKGVSINLIAGADELSKMKDIETYYSLVIPVLPEDLSVLSASK